jgi:hypothetical protein
MFVLNGWTYSSTDRAWMLPEGNTAAVDLSPLTRSGSVGVMRGTNGIVLSRHRSERLTSRNRRLLASAAGFCGYVPPGTIGEVLHFMLTVAADPHGERMAKPLVPCHTGESLILCGDSRPLFATRSVGRSLVHGRTWRALQSSLHQDYRDTRAEAMQAEDEYGSTLHSRWLECQRRKFRFSPESAMRLLIPADCPQERLVLPATTLTDTFVRADQNDWGTAPGGWSWSRVHGSSTDWVISSNKGAYVGGSNYPGVIRANSALSSSDTYSETSLMTHTSNGQDKWLACRDTGGWQTAYLHGHYDLGNNWRLYKSVGGTRTQIGNLTNEFRTSMPIGCEANGSAIRGYEPGYGTRTSATDTSISSGTYTAVWSWAGGRGTFDDFTSGDLVGSGPSIPVLAHHYRQLARA